MDRTSIIGTKVRYNDYLGFESFGKVVAVEPYPHDDNVVYLYIADDDVSFNDKTYDDGITEYAEIRLSTEVALDE